MKKVHVYALKPYDSYGGEFRVNHLAFYARNDVKLGVTDVTYVSESEATFKVNGINGRIHIPRPYGYSYYSSHVFSTSNSYSDTLMVQNNTNAPDEEKGFYIYFDQDVKFEYITLAFFENDPKDFVVQLDDEPVTEPVNGTRGTVFKIPTPMTQIRCFVGNDGIYYFLRPEDDSPPKEVSATEEQA